MPAVAEETARISQHADKPAEEAEIAEGVELPFHSFFLVKEPPAAAELNLARHAAVLKISKHGGEDVVIRRIEIVENGLRQPVVSVQPVKIPGQGRCLRVVADGIEAGIRAKRAQESRIIVALGAEV